MNDLAYLAAFAVSKSEELPVELRLRVLRGASQLLPEPDAQACRLASSALEVAEDTQRRLFETVSLAVDTPNPTQP